ncbi:ribonuclease Z [Mesonia ostreae]|uniref:Ribonuclease Z n=1 Tax=Mesonia ostreae TaxID=861110 RepID=A0ABU2KKF5_9FLAO|nr:ribonuclease Z [Mesonia ostreae]MDT0295154.1 ribonuclease Z [Mesonia ostreae]
MQLTILGCYAATPRTYNHTTSQVLNIANHMFLIDCGEGTQMQLRRQKVKFSRIKHVFISHLHGDHFFGLIGLVSTFNLLGRETDLHIYGPKGIKEIITLQLKMSKSWTGYGLYFHELSSNSPELIFENDKVTVETIPLDHRVYTNGYLFKEKEGDRKLLMNEVLNYDIDKAYYRSIKKGKDVTLEDGTLVKNELLTSAPPPIKSYAFCSDTAYLPSITNQIKGVTALYHESTFLESHEHLCKPTKHSTAKQAALIAKEAEAKQLILGHYSTRYDDLQLFKEEAETYFINVTLAEDGKRFSFD